MDSLEVPLALVTLSAHAGDLSPPCPEEDADLFSPSARVDEYASPYHIW